MENLCWHDLLKKKHFLKSPDIRSRVPDLLSWLFSLRTRRRGGNWPIFVRNSNSGAKWHILATLPQSMFHPAQSSIMAFGKDEREKNGFPLLATPSVRR